MPRLLIRCVFVEEAEFQLLSRWHGQSTIIPLEGVVNPRNGPVMPGKVSLTRIKKSLWFDDSTVWLGPSGPIEPASLIGIFFQYSEKNGAHWPEYYKSCIPVINGLVN